MADERAGIGLGGEAGQTVNGEDVAPGFGEAAVAEPMHRAEDEPAGAAAQGLERRWGVEQ